MKRKERLQSARWEKVFRLIQADLILLYRLREDGIQNVDVNIEIGNLEEAGREVADIIQSEL